MLCQPVLLNLFLLILAIQITVCLCKQPLLDVAGELRVSFGDVRFQPSFHASVTPRIKTLLYSCSTHFNDMESISFHFASRLFGNFSSGGVDVLYYANDTFARDGRVLDAHYCRLFLPLLHWNMLQQYDYVVYIDTDVVVSPLIAQTVHRNLYRSRKQFLITYKIEFKKTVLRSCLFAFVPTSDMRTLMLDWLDEYTPVNVGNVWDQAMLHKLLLRQSHTNVLNDLICVVPERCPNLHIAHCYHEMERRTECMHHHISQVDSQGIDFTHSPAQCGCLSEVKPLRKYH